MSTANVDQPEEGRKPRRRVPRTAVEPATDSPTGSEKVNSVADIGDLIWGTDSSTVDIGDLLFGNSSGEQENDGETVSLDDHRQVKGLGEHEVIDRTYRFDGDVYHRLCYLDPKGEKDTYRMVHRQRKQDETGSVVQTLVPIFDGALTCTERSVHVAIDPRTRTLKSEVSDESFLFQYEDNLGNPVRSTVVTDTELLETGTGKGKKNWMTRLGLSSIVRPGKHNAVLVLLRAVAFNARKTGEVTVRVIDQSGPIFIDDQWCYANAAGYIGPTGDRIDGMGYVFNADGPLAGVRCRPHKDTEQYRDVEYPVSMPETRAARQASLNALAELFTGYADVGVTGVLVGQLLAAPMSGAMVRGDIRVASVASIIGPSRSGKTAYDLLLFTSQTRRLFGEIEPEFNVRCNGASGSTTAPGVYQHLAPFSGVRSLLDDVMKEGWSEKEKQTAHTIMFEKAVTFIVGGGVKQAQGNNGKVEAAATKKLYHSACFTAECLAPVPNLLEDSTYNRVALVWWETDKRCARLVYDRLKSREHTLVRNNGMRVVLDVLLRNPDSFADGYDVALTALREAGIDERVSKNYARCLAGLHILDLAYRENGKTTHYLAEAIDPAIEIAQRFEAYGSNGGDQMARTNLAEATREAIAVVLDIDRSVFIAEPPEKMPKGVPAVPTEPEHLPYGFGPGDCGWYPEGDCWKHKSSAVQVGILIEKVPGSGGRSHPFPYRVEMKVSEFNALHDKLNYVSALRGYRQCSREERVAALTEIGALREARSPATSAKLYQLNYLWIRSATFEDVVKAEADDAKAEGGE